MMAGWVLMVVSVICASATFSQSTSMQKAMCYSAMHNPEYSRNGGKSPGLDKAMLLDFEQIKKYTTLVRTFYSDFSDYPVAPAAAAYNVSLYLGVYMTNESWYRKQRDAAVDAAVKYPHLVKAILIGNENLKPNGPFSAQEIIDRITEIKELIKQRSPSAVIPPMGTVQRITEWTSTDVSTRAETDKLFNSCDILGVNIYPIYSSSYKKENPLKMLDSQWNKMMDRFGEAKVRLTETGYPTDGGDISSNIPTTLEDAMIYYKAFLDWKPVRGNGPAFYYSFYDRRPDDDSLKGEYKKHFGLFTYDRIQKDRHLPQLIN